MTPFYEGAQAARDSRNRIKAGEEILDLVDELNPYLHSTEDFDQWWKGFSMQCDADLFEDHTKTTDLTEEEVHDILLEDDDDEA